MVRDLVIVAALVVLAVLPPGSAQAAGITSLPATPVTECVKPDRHDVVVHRELGSDDRGTRGPGPPYVVEAKGCSKTIFDCRGAPSLQRRHHVLRERRENDGLDPTVRHGRQPRLRPAEPGATGVQELGAP
mgnify:CR=1 FL=1